MTSTQSILKLRQVTVITGFYAKLTRSMKLIHGQGDQSPILVTSDRLPSHPINKDEEPQTAVLPLLWPISVAH